MITTISICDLCDACRSTKNLCSHVDSDSTSEANGRICSELKSLNGSIADAQYALLRAVDRRRAYLEEVNRHSDPIQRLPVELATSIFTFCLPRPPSLDIFDVFGNVAHFSPRHFFWVLSVDIGVGSYGRRLICGIFFGCMCLAAQPWHAPKCWLNGSVVQA